MAVTSSKGSWIMTAAADVALAASGTSIKVNSVIIVKATAGTVTLKDDAGNVLLTTHSLADLSMTQIPMYGIELMGIEYDAVSAGTAVVTVIGQCGSNLSISKN
jgi:hypothetical protein